MTEIYFTGKKNNNYALDKNIIHKNSTKFSNKNEMKNIKLKEKIIKILGSIDIYENKKCNKCIPNYKFPEIRWDENTKSENPDTMTDIEIKKKFQLLTNQRNQEKREVCRKCYQSGKRGVAFRIPYFYKGNEKWDDNIPKKGSLAELGCEGCAWYDFAEWRKHLLNDLENHE